MIRKLLVGLAASCLAGAACATTYTYIGPNFQFTGGVGYTTSMSITGTFTTASPLPGNMALTDIGPAPGGLNLVTGWSFTDGVNTYTKANSIPLGNLWTNFMVQTDGQGNINGFYIQLSGPPPPNSLFQPMHVITMTTPGSPRSLAMDAAPCQVVPVLTCTGIGSGANFGESTSSGAFTPNGLAAPTITNAFGAATVPINGSTSLTFHINNPNAGVVLTGVAFIDTLPAGLIVATPSNLSSTCGGTATAAAGSGIISLSGGTMAAGVSCAISVNVTGISVGSKENSIQVTSTEGGIGNTSQAFISVMAPPAIIKVFGAPSISVKGSTRLDFTIRNNNIAQLLSGVSFTDTLPAGLIIATPSGLNGDCDGIVTAIQGAGTITLAGATIAPSASCSIEVIVTGTTGGTKNNTTGNVTAAESGAGGTASARLVVQEAATVSTLEPRMLSALILLLLAGGFALLAARKPPR